MSLLRRRRQTTTPHSGGGNSESDATPGARKETSATAVAEEQKYKSQSMMNDPDPSPSGLGVQSMNGVPILKYAFAKWLILRTIGAIYFIAFLGAWNQNIGLMGQYGLMSAADHWKTVQNKYDSSWKGFLEHPSIFWWIPMNDSSLRGLFGTGMALSAMVVFVGINSWMLQSALWILYFSVVTTAEGTTFYAYGWESQLLETGFLAIFLCALPYVHRGRLWFCLRESTHHHSKKELAPSYIILWLFRWLCFRISIGAGLIKIRGSSCWAEKTCLHHHFETQPIPSPLSYFYHFLPKSVQSSMIDIDLIVQLYTSFLVLLPTFIPYSETLTSISRLIVRVGGIVQAGFMVGIVLSGNFAFLNHLTIVPALACLDDICWPAFLTRRNSFQFTPQLPVDEAKSTDRYFLPRNALDGLLLLYICYLSSPVVSNLLQLDGHQVMNASFDPFRLVNTYGAFGSVGERRYEPIVMISDDGEYWVELEFPCKPGSTSRRPCFCAPYHYRVDWNIWFLGFKPHKMYLNRREFWMYTLLTRLLEGGHQPRPWLDLLDRS